MKKNTYTVISSFIILTIIYSMTSCFSKPQIKKRKVGNTEIIDNIENNKPVYRLIYTFENGKKVRGEYWEYIDPKKKKDKKPESNILTGTAMARKCEAMLSRANVKDNSRVKLNIEKDGFSLKFVKIVKYNTKGLPEKVIARGYTAYPVLGAFNLKTDYKYTYDNNGRLMKITEKNLNVDSLLLNLGIGNKTKIERDAKGRPVKVKKKIDSMPPVIETTEYYYTGDTSNMQKTVYQKCGIDTKKLAIAPSETITCEYGSGIPWEGKKKYKFSMGKTITGFSVYNEIDKKQELDGSNFMDMSYFDKGLFLKNIYGYYKNEKKGPKWRIGELPDVPEPFLIYEELTWW